jgi:hypothetical protein
MWGWLLFNPEALNISRGGAVGNIDQIISFQTACI